MLLGKGWDAWRLMSIWFLVADPSEERFLDLLRLYLLRRTVRSFVRSFILSFVYSSIPSLLPAPLLLSPLTPSPPRSHRAKANQSSPQPGSRQPDQPLASPPPNLQKSRLLNRRPNSAKQAKQSIRSWRYYFSYRRKQASKQARSCTYISIYQEKKAKQNTTTYYSTAPAR